MYGGAIQVYIAIAIAITRPAYVLEIDEWVCGDTNVWVAVPSQQLRHLPAMYESQCALCPPDEVVESMVTSWPASLRQREVIATFSVHHSTKRTASCFTIK